MKPSNIFELHFPFLNENNKNGMYAQWECAVGAIKMNWYQRVLSTYTNHKALNNKQEID